MTERHSGLLSSLSIVIALVFAFAFFALLIGGYRLVGSVGLIMCLTMAFFDTIPIPPMGGRSIYDWNKTAWFALFATSISAYAVSLLLL